MESTEELEPEVEKSWKNFWNHREQVQKRITSWAFLNEYGYDFQLDPDIPAEDPEDPIDPSQGLTVNNGDYAAYFIRSPDQSTDGYVSPTERGSRIRHIIVYKKQKGDWNELGSYDDNCPGDFNVSAAELRKPNLLNLLETIVKVFG